MDYLYTVKDVSLILNRDPRSIRRLIRAGKLKGNKDSRKEGYYVTKDDLIDFVSKHTSYRSARYILEFEKSGDNFNNQGYVEELKRTIWQLKEDIYKLENILNSF